MQPGKAAGGKRSFIHGGDDGEKARGLRGLDGGEQLLEREVRRRESERVRERNNYPKLLC